jgi:hypothetical protein
MNRPPLWGLSSWLISGLENGTRVLLALLVFLAVLSRGPLSAQTNSGVIVTKPSPTANRFLFIVETSRAMKGRTNGVRSTVQNLLVSEMGGQLERGDTLGVWTFSDGLHAGQFPLQLWAPQLKPSIIARISGFLKEQGYDKPAALEKVMPAMDRVIKSSPFITVILIYSGQDPMIGTPFDKQINELHKQWAKEEQKAHMPFITVFRAKGGTITDFSVTPAPWPVEFPPLPVELTTARAAAKPPAPPVPPKAQPRPVPPLIISGKKPAPQTTESAAPATNSATPLTHPTTESSQPVTTNGPTASPAPASQSASGQPPPSTVSSSGTIAGPQESAGLQAVPPVTAAAGQQLAKSETTTALASLTSPQPPGSVSAPLASTPVQGAVGGPMSAKPASAIQPLPAGAPTTSTDLTATPTTRSDSGSVSLPGPNAVAITTRAVFSWVWIWIAGLVLAAVVSAMAMSVRRRARAGSRASLITRSLDRQGKA